jgi:hypothetical protein
MQERKKQFAAPRPWRPWPPGLAESKFSPSELNSELRTFSSSPFDQSTSSGYDFFFDQIFFPGNVPRKLKNVETEGAFSCMKHIKDQLEQGVARESRS